MNPIYQQLIREYRDAGDFPFLVNSDD